MNLHEKLSLSNELIRLISLLKDEIEGDNDYTKLYYKLDETEKELLQYSIKQTYKQLNS